MVMGWEGYQYGISIRLVRRERILFSSWGHFTQKRMIGESKGLTNLLPRDLVSNEYIYRLRECSVLMTGDTSSKENKVP
jgi:hypothetical protein